ncbi:hypothetical protein EDB85DRAFT_1897009 [Lactarius pseudohatsudake]|nr:hypothetical protein EDB85DRAFT_1897009 [Lactarius pseudohatsudake]
MASLVTTSISRNGLDQTNQGIIPALLCKAHGITHVRNSTSGTILPTGIASDCSPKSAVHQIVHVRYHVTQWDYTVYGRCARLLRLSSKSDLFAVQCNCLARAGKLVCLSARRWPMAVSGWFALTNLLIDLPVMFTGTVEVGEVCWFPYLAFVLGRPGTFRSHWCSSLPTASTKASTASALSSISA